MLKGKARLLGTENNRGNVKFSKECLKDIAKEQKGKKIAVKNFGHVENLRVEKNELICDFVFDNLKLGLGGVVLKQLDLPDGTAQIVNFKPTDITLASWK